MNRYKRVALALLMITSLGSQAAGDLVAQIQLCRQIDNSEARLACYDELSNGVDSAGKISESSTYQQQAVPQSESADVAHKQTTTVPAAVAGEQTPTVSAAVPAEQTTTVPAGLEREQTATLPAGVVQEQTAAVPAVVGREQTATVLAEVVQEQTTTAPSRQIIEEDFGFEQKRAAAARDKEGPIYVEVSNVKKDRAGASTIYLANGQVWRQIGSDRFFYSEKQGRAYLERGSLNSFFFSQEKIKRRIRVKRLQ